MPDRERDLERELRELGSHLEYPRTPDLADSARRRIESEDEARANRRGLFWLPALSPRWAVAAMFVIVLAVPALSPTVREEISGLFVTGVASSGAGGGAARSADQAGSPGEDKVISEPAGQAESQDSAVGEPGAQQAQPESGADTPESAAGGQGTSGEAPESGGGAYAFDPKGIGKASVGFATERITLQKARSRAGEAPILLPRTPKLGSPDEVYAAAPSGVGGVAFVYNTRPGLPPIDEAETGLILTEIPSDIGWVFLGDGLETVRLETVKLDGGRGFWVPGGRGLPKTADSTAPPGGVLLWDRDGRALRLESNLGKTEAVRIAGSVR